jgi:hypothetical protein
MKKTICPGQDTRYWRPGDIFDVSCGKCGGSVEFFKDDAARRCRTCGARVENPKISLGCAQWCEYAKECLGYDPKSVELSGDEESVTDRIIEAMKGVFGDDQERITHALTVYEYAREILKGEGGDPRIVTAAALLHDIGIQEAEKKYGAPTYRGQEELGPAIARDILEGIGFADEDIEHVCAIVGNHHTADGMDTVEFRIIWDADMIVNMPDEVDLSDAKEVEQVIATVSKTKTGREIARRLYVTEKENANHEGRSAHGR